MTAVPPQERRWKPELLLLCALAALTRFWGLFHPHVVVFDERLFEEYAGAYFTGRFYFDVHPPLGKLLVAGAARLLGVPGTTLVRIEPAVAVRILPATAGVLLVPLMWLLLRQLRAGRTVAALGAGLVLLDNGLLVQSRFILLDTMLMAFGLGAVTLYLAGRARRGAARWWLLAASGICAGLASSVKWTGLAALGLILLALAVEVVRHRRTWLEGAGHVAVVIAPAAAVYVASFAIHFALLHRSGPGDPWMPATFTSTLEGNPNYDPAARVSFVTAFVALNRSMAHGQGMLREVKHEYASPWYAWPFMIRPLHLWRSAPLAHERIENIHLFGNPVVWIGVIAGIAITIAGMVRRSARLRSRRNAFALLATALAINYLPFAAVARELFIYSYFPALLFAIALTVLGVGALMGWTDDGERLFRFTSTRSAAVYWAILGAVLVGFLIVSPISYGWPTSQHGLYEYTPYHVQAPPAGHT